MSSCQVTNNLKPTTSVCDSILSKVADNWKYTDKHYFSNVSFIRTLENNKMCFVGKDSVEINKIFGIDHKLTPHKIVKYALFYDVKFNKESQVALLFVLDKDGHVEDIDTVYISKGDTEN